MKAKSIMQTAMISLLLLLLFACGSLAAPRNARKSTEEILQDLQAIQTSVKQHANSLRFVGAIRFDAVQLLSKDPVDKILITRIENKFRPYFAKVLDFDGGFQEDKVIQWMKEEKDPKEELKISQKHLEESRSKLQEYIDAIADLKERSDRESSVVKTDDDRMYVLVKSLISFHSLLPGLQASQHELDFAVAKLQQLLHPHP